MEPDSKSINKIDSLLTEVINLLIENDEPSWGKLMNKLLINFRNSEDKKYAATLIMKPMLGGMGSLSDLALYRNGKPLIEENRTLRILLNELYNTCKYL